MASKKEVESLVEQIVKGKKSPEEINELFKRFERIKEEDDKILFETVAGPIRDGMFAAIDALPLPQKTKDEYKSFFEKKSVKDFLVESIFAFGDKQLYKSMESKFASAINKQDVKPFLRSELDSLCSFFNCSNQPRLLVGNWKIFIESDFRPVTGVDLPMSLKNILTDFFNKHRAEIEVVVAERTSQNAEEGWTKVKDMDSQKLLELVRNHIVKFDEDKRIEKYLQAYCKILKILSEDKDIEGVYDDLEFHLYRNLKSEMRKLGITGMRNYFEKIQITDSELQSIWAFLRAKILYKMDVDSYLD